MNVEVRLNVAQARAVDRRAHDDYAMSTLVLMENAGRGCADVLEQLGIHGPVVIGCGKGNNGGDGFVVARHLELRGHSVRVLLFADPSSLRGDAATNWKILQHGQTPCDVFLPPLDEPRLTAALAGAGWIVDALLGTGTSGAPRPPYDAALRLFNAAPARRLAIDLPSGLDADTGQAASPTFRADHTCTFVASKVGFFVESARPWLGTLHVCDIGIPAKLLREISR